MMYYILMSTHSQHTSELSWLHLQSAVPVVGISESLLYYKANNQSHRTVCLLLTAVLTTNKRLIKCQICLTCPSPGKQNIWFSGQRQQEDILYPVARWWLGSCKIWLILALLLNNALMQFRPSLVHVQHLIQTFSHLHCRPEKSMWSEG